ncbi:MAG: peroxiredoxin [Bacteroidetes bacterium QH_2_63_10]|nr:MAG: peroxiredoxin [Bacteroidetes bacterium QH_2_63_10]
MPTRSADARWEGNLSDGNGTMKLESGAYEGAFSYRSRFEDGAGSNPEELIAAAHAGCFSMAFSNVLDDEGYDPESVDTTAEVTLRTLEDGPAITKIHLTSTASVPGIDEDTFQDLADAAKSGCPVSKALAGAEITLDATLEG